MAKKLYDISREEDSLQSFLPNINISNEMISPQLNDYVIPIMEESYQRVLDLVKEGMLDGSINNVNMLLNNKKVAQELDKVNSIISKRFGITFKHICDKRVGVAATLPIQPEAYNIMQQGTMEDFFNYVRENGKTTNEQDKIKDDVKSLDDDVSLMQSVYKSHIALEKTMNADGVVIDLNKAVMRGLPSDYLVYIIHDWCYCVNLEITAREVVAITLHEIGHCWNAIEYSYRCFNNTTVLIETFIDNYRKRNKSYKESLLIAYRTATNDQSLEKLKDKNSMSLSIVVLNSISNDRKLGNNNNSSIDNENLADSFATAFGLGGELSAGLTKIIKPEKRLQPTYRALCVLQKLSIAIICGLAFVLVLPMFPIIISGLLILFGIQNIAEAWLVFRMEKKDVGNLVYDDAKRRIERVRLNTIKILRDSSLDKKIVNDVLKQLDVIDGCLRLYPDSDYSIFSKIFQKGKIEMKELEIYTENLMNNDLHVASAKLKQLV